MAARRSNVAGLIATVAMVAVVLAGCAGMATTGPPAETVVPIASFDAVKGKWAGIVKRTSPASRREDLVELTVNEDGTFRFASARTIGVMQGGGKLTLKDGQLSSASERGSATYRLLEQGGKRVLKVDAVDRDGYRFSADLTR
ncbi:MAG: hypothetical protein ACREJV_11440 [Candidatus Rokuibacteriota bacterium]